MTRAVNTALAGSGGVLQVVQTVKSDTFSTTGTSFVEITGLTVSITPVSTSSKILVNVAILGGETSDSFPAMRLLRNGTAVVLGDSIPPGQQATFGYVNTGADARDQYLLTTANYTYLDSPASVSAVTYSVQVRPMGTASRTFYLNRPQTIGDVNQFTATSTITVMEIAG